MAKQFEIAVAEAITKCKTRDQLDVLEELILECEITTFHEGIISAITLLSLDNQWWGDHRGVIEYIRKEKERFPSPYQSLIDSQYPENF